MLHFGLMDRKKGFSLAEALITLLIICIVVAMTMHMLSKNRKFKKKTGEQTTWACTIDPATGKHIVISDDPATGETDGSSCTFIPPKNVSEFTVLAIGGGGGGASGSSSTYMAQTRDGFINFVPPITGDYYIIVVGGGGGGGGKNCGDDAAQGGGSGGVVAGVFQLKGATTYTLTAGKGGTGGKRAKTGGEGEQSSFTGGGLNLIAGGGKGGYGKYKKGLFRCNKGYGEGKGGTYSGGPGSNGEDAPYGGYGYAPGYVCRDVNRQCLVAGLADRIGPSVQDIGKGGLGAQGHTSGGEGLPGFVKAVYNPIYSGEGGRSGMQAYYTYKRSPGKTKVVIGKGGKGATLENADGLAGEASRFGDRVIAAGGAGGYKEYKNGSLDDPTPKVEGGDGGSSPAPRTLKDYDFSTEPFGGLTAGNSSLDGLTINAPGAGGGGGGANGSGWGKGGDGANGLVLITW